MSDCQEFPNTWEEFEQLYGFEDKKEIYTNGSRLIQSFRVKQWLDHITGPEREKGKWIPVESQTVNGRCSVCGYESYLYENDVYGENYCPNCGARMETK